MRATLILALLTMLAWPMAMVLADETALPPPPASQQGSSIEAVLKAVNDAPDPSATISAYSRGLAAFGKDPRLHEAYLNRLIQLEVPEIGIGAAQTLIGLNPDNGLGWAVIAYAYGRNWRMPDAITAIVLAADRLPHNDFVLRTAGSLLAWYDSQPNPPVPDSVRQLVDKLRKASSGEKAFAQAYEQAAAVYKQMAETQQNPPTTGDGYYDYGTTYNNYYSSPGYYASPAVYPGAYYPYAGDFFYWSCFPDIIVVRDFDRVCVVRRGDRDHDRDPVVFDRDHSFLGNHHVLADLNRPFRGRGNTAISGGPRFDGGKGFANPHGVTSPGGRGLNGGVNSRIFTIPSGPKSGSSRTFTFIPQASRSGGVFSEPKVSNHAEFRGGWASGSSTGRGAMPAFQGGGERPSFSPSPHWSGGGGGSSFSAPASGGGFSGFHGGSGFSGGHGGRR